MKEGLTIPGDGKRWAAVPQPDGTWLVLVPGGTVEMLPGVIGHGRTKVICQVREPAKALLMAASPDMYAALAALIEAVKYVEDVTAPSSDGSFQSDELRAALAAGTAALTKAKGKATR